MDMQPCIKSDSAHLHQRSWNAYKVICAFRGPRSTRGLLVDYRAAVHMRLALAGDASGVSVQSCSPELSQIYLLLFCFVQVCMLLCNMKIAEAEAAVHVALSYGDTCPMPTSERHGV